MSTARSGEDTPQPGPTLSSLIVRFDHFRPVLDSLAMNYRLNGLSMALARAAGPESVA